MRDRPRLRVVQHDKPELLRDLPLEREVTLRSWLRSAARLAVTAAVLGLGWAFVEGVLLVIRR
jgi:hypothetical protein